MNIRKIGIVLFAALVIASLAACSNDDSGTTEAGRDQITLKVADTFPKTHVISAEGIQYWMDRVEKRTDGRVTFQYFPSEQLGKAGSMLDLVKKNVADVTSSVPAYLGDRLIPAQVSELPGLFDTALQGSLAYDTILHDNEQLQKLYAKNNAHVLWGAVLGPYQVSTKNRKIESVDDFKGLKIRASGNTQELLYRALGASPIAMPAPDTYVALERGTIDGTSYLVPNWEAYSLQEELKYSTINGSFGTTAYGYLINQDTWAQLPKDIQQAMTEAARDTARHFGEYLDNAFDKKVAKFRDMGIDMYDMPDEELAKAYDIVQKPTFEDWRRKVDAKGYDASSILEAYRDALNANDATH